VEYGIHYKQKDLLPDGTPDLEAVAEAAKESRMVYIQRSRGYSLRPSLTIAQIEKIVKAAKAANPEVVVMVDNCYGEFVEKLEPCDVGADLMAGSLIKNPGGGIALTGGYIAGRHDLVEACAFRLSCPGVGREVGCTHDQLRPMYQGIFYAPTVVEAAVKTAEFAASLFSGLGFGVTPEAGEYRTDIIQAVKLENAQRLCAFCKGIQKGSPVDSFVTPEPWAMPGYDNDVIMAAGAFTLGASIELSADAPLREPFAVWMQGGLTWPSGKTGVMLAAQSMLEEGLIQ
jgi:cystathionine beta-lyase family protein involved in aluminum resistance